MTARVIDSWHSGTRCWPARYFSSEDGWGAAARCLLSGWPLLESDYKWVSRLNVGRSNRWSFLCPVMSLHCCHVTQSSANWKWQFVRTEVASVSAENAKMLAHSLQQLPAEQVRSFSHSLQSRRLRLTKWWLMVYKSWQLATIAWYRLTSVFGNSNRNNAGRFAGRKQSLNGQ